MTDREKAIVMAHTGICMLAGDKFQIFHQYVEDILGRPVQTIEMGIGSVCDEIKEKSRDDFIVLCREEQEQYGDFISREAVMHILDEVGGDFDSPREAVVPIDYIADMVSDLPSVTPQPKMGYISIDDVMAVFDDFMRGDVDENNTETFLEMLKDKAEGSEE